MAPQAERPEPFSRPLPAAGVEPPQSAAEVPLVVDCERCSVRGAGCPDCVVTFLLGGPPDDVQLDAEEQRALDVLASAGLIPPLRMVQSLDSHTYDDSP
jgi:hypothetical protein